MRNSPSSRFILVHVSPPSVDRNIWPMIVQQKISIGSAGLVPIHQMVELTGIGRPASSQVSPQSRLRRSRPVSPEGRSPTDRNITPD